ncbi:MAG: hypothetical protein LBP98_09805, partial [Tannerella sp.]|nr:hypothetical protein [Tannerella sp.]
MMEEKSTTVSLRVLHRRAGALLAALTVCISLHGQPLAGVDGLGRVLLQHGAVGDPRPDRRVGLFYFLWMTDSAERGSTQVPRDAWDLTEITARHPEVLEDFDSKYWGASSAYKYYFWGQPIWGYYRF